MVTKVKRITGGVPSLPGDQGLTGQVLTKLSNTAGDYGWANIPQAVVNKINNAANTNVVSVTTSGTDRIDFTVGGSVRMRLTTSGIDSLQSINGTNISGYLNPSNAPSAYPDMISPTNYTVNKQWTAEKIETLIDNSVTIPQAIPSGSITNYAGSTAPSGWLECNAQKIRAAEHPSLYSAIGDTYTEEWDHASWVGIANVSAADPQCLTLYNDKIYYVGVVNGTPDEIYVESTEKDFVTSLWSTRVMADSTSNTVVAKFIKAANGEIYVGVQSNSAPYLSKDVFVTVLNATTGVIVRTFNLPDVLNFPVGSLTGTNVATAIDSSGNLYVHRYVSSNPVFSKYDSTGVVVWTYDLSSNSLGAYYSPRVAHVDEASSSVYIGSSYSLGSSSVFIKINLVTGSYIFNTPVESNKYPSAIEVMPNGNILTAYRKTDQNSSYKVMNGTTGAFIGTVTETSFAEIAGNPYLVRSYPVDMVKDPVSGDIFILEATVWSSYTTSIGASYHRISFSGNAVTLEVSGFLNIVAFPSLVGLELFIDSNLTLFNTRQTNLMVTNLDGFKVPDLRGEFVRGWDHGRGIDSTRALGSHQDEQTNLDGSVSKLNTINLFGEQNYGSRTSLTTDDFYPGSPDLVSPGYETRPRNVALMYIIKT